MNDDTKMREMTEKMLATSTIDDPTATRMLLQEMESSLPIAARITARGAESLKAQGHDDVDADRIVQIEKIFYMGDVGGILCALSVEKKDADDKPNQVVISITHLQVDSKHPLAPKIREYQKKRTIRIALFDKLQGRPPGKGKKKKRGFST